MKDKVGILFYEVGNLKSIANALSILNIDFKLIENSREIKNFKKIILPGVGSYSEAKKSIKKKGFDVEIKNFINKSDNYLLGICLGMQLLLDKSLEFKTTKGLSLISGDVIRIDDNGLTVPNIGWFNLKKINDSILLNNFKKKELCFYFAHSFYCNLKNSSNKVASLESVEKITSVIQKKNIFGCQFHPEKSQKSGLKFLKNFCEL